MSEKGKILGMPNADSWQNELTGLGIEGIDKRMSGVMGVPVLLDQSTLENLYQGDFLARKIVLFPPKEMTREGVEIIPDEIIESKVIDKIYDDMDRLEIWKTIRRALQWSRLYGGGVVVMIIEDGGESFEPVNIKAIKAIKGVYDLNRYQIYPIEYQNDPDEPGFLNPTMYQLVATANSPTGIQSSISINKKFHRSRLMIFDGIDLPEHLRTQNDGWGDSILQVLYNELRNYHTGQDSAATLVSDFSQAVFKIKGLHSKIAANSGSVISARMQLVNLSRSIIKATVIDADGEEFERKTTNIAGLADLLKRFESAIIAASEIPHTILFGESPSGLGATGQSEEKDWKDYIRGLQEEKIRPELDLFFKYYSAASDYKLNNKPINYSFVSLWQMNDKEKAEIRKIISEADKNNIQFSVYSPLEARSRYEGGEFSLDVSLDEEGQMSLNNSTEEGM